MQQPRGANSFCIYMHCSMCHCASAGGTAASAGAGARAAWQPKQRKRRAKLWYPQVHVQSPFLSSCAGRGGGATAESSVLAVLQFLQLARLLKFEKLHDGHVQSPGRGADDGMVA